MNAARGCARLVAGEPFLLKAPRPVKTIRARQLCDLAPGDRDAPCGGPSSDVSRRKLGGRRLHDMVEIYVPFARPHPQTRSQREPRPRGQARGRASRPTTASRTASGLPTRARLAVVGLLARGHILIEDVPGVGKTT